MRFETYENIRFLFEQSTDPSAVVPSDLLRAYTNLLQDLQKRITAAVPNDPFTTVPAQVEKHIISHITTATNIQRPSPIGLPFLSKERVLEWKTRFEDETKEDSNSTKTDKLLAAMAGILTETKSAIHYSPNIDQSPTRFAFGVELASYMAWKAIDQASGDARIEIAAFTEKMKSDVQSERLKLHNTVGAAQSKLIALQQLEIDLQKSIADGRENEKKNLEGLQQQANAARSVVDELQGRADALRSTLDTNETSLSNFEAAVREELKIDSVKKLWQNRSASGLIAFSSSAILIAAALLLPPLWVFTNIEIFTTALNRLGDAASLAHDPNSGAAQLTAATISRLVIISLPIALYLWGIKLLVRFNTRSLVLMDDARQRETMMDTYFHLIEHGAASKEERALVLNALFRPTPGHGGEHVDPPNFTDLLGKNSGSGN